MFHFEPTIGKEIAITAISNFQNLLLPKLQLLKVDETESQQYRISMVILPW